MPQRRVIGHHVAGVGLDHGETPGQPKCDQQAQALLGIPRATLVYRS